MKTVPRSRISKAGFAKRFCRGLHIIKIEIKIQTRIKERLPNCYVGASGCGCMLKG
ncbi:hypothetical protein MESS4_320087 [Mesorhizobium sp. STM 4661]|nr:hypothetical protein MESS4_320087 [Mesorhizobium sp. STM 4661]